MIETENDLTYRRTTFPNGLRLLSATMPHTRSVAISIYVGAGSRYETTPESGISHFVEHMCFKGSEKRPTAQLISEAIDGVGGVINAATDREFTVFYAKVVRSHFDLGLDVLVDLLQRPLIAAEELEKERKVILEELASIADSPGQQAEVLLDQVLWPDQPLGWDVAGSKESISGIGREMVLDYIGRQYVPNNIVVSIAGNIEHEEVEAALASSLGVQPAGAPGSWFPAMDGQESPRSAVLFKRTEQAHISMALRGLSLNHPDRYALDLLSVLFGEGMSSRLFQELRERRGLCYEVNSYASHYLDTGAFSVYAAVDPTNAKSAVAALIEQLARLREGIPEEELRKAKELTKGRMLLRMEDTRAVSGWLGGQEVLTGRVMTLEEALTMIESVSPPDLQRVVAELLQPERLNLAVVGPFRSDKAFAAALLGL